jgi:flagellar biosynthesis/type III secretory pathway protein FliH
MFRSAQANTAEFHQPLLRLSLHLAQQLVRGELSLSSAAVERLIKGVLEDLEQQGEGPVVVYMNPLDRQSLSASLEGELDDLDLRGDQQLCRGSLRLSMDDSAIEDLLEHRLNSLSDALLGINIQPDLETEPKFANPVTEKIIQTSESQALNSQVSEPQSEPSIETEINDPEQGFDDEPAS